MKWYQWFRFSTYEYGKQHSKEFILEDARYIGGLCLIAAFVMGSILTFVIACPQYRFDSGVDNLPKLFFSTVFGFLGYILTRLQIKNETMLLKERRFCRIYLASYFLFLSIYEYMTTDVKTDAIYVYLIYCVVVVVAMHINPIFFMLQGLLLFFIALPSLYEYYQSLGVIFSLAGLLGGMMFLSFDSNIKVQKKLRNIDKISAHRAELENELQKKTAQVIDSITKQNAIQENVILAIADLVESRDTETGIHVKATSFYVELIARNAKAAGMYAELLTDEFIKTIVKAAPMHDLGKIVIPDAILQAPRRLTNDEFDIMKTHATEGARIIRHIYEKIESSEYIECAANIAHYHHERWDGNGYPNGMCGEEIPLEARIMSIADVFDALVSKRCYKDSFPLSQAFEEIEKNAGTQFDPDLAKLFLKSRKLIEEKIINQFE